MGPRTSRVSACGQPIMIMSLIFGLFCVVASTGEQNCPTEEPCLGGRPRTPIGCCPVEGGDDCGTEVGVQCDTGLGYTCQDAAGNLTTLRGTCRGRYNVHVTDTGMDGVSLEWDDFKPQNYMFEYVLLFRKDSYTDDTAEWTQWDIGTEPHYIVNKLSPGTLYFMRLAVWGDDRFTVLANLTETIWVVTEPASHCSHNGQTFEVGQVVENCEDRCTCMATGHLDCTPVCPELELPEVPEGCTLVYEAECSCNATVQCPREQAPCEFEAEEYEPGSTVTLGCRTCYCHLGTMSCAYPGHCRVMEATEECPYPTATPDPDGGCCPSWTCNAGVTTVTPSAEGCEHKGNSYADRASWTDTEDCTTCTCEAGHVSCQYMCEEPVVPEGCLNPTLQHTAESGCCEVIVCGSTGPAEDECNHNGTIYRVGDTFTSECSLCLCTHGNTINCSSTTCPSLDMPVPSILCPFPQVQRDGCCDIVTCYDENGSMDPQALMSRLMAISFGPDSLTISFDVDHRTSQDTVTRDRYEVMTSDSGSDADSWNSRTFTPNTVDTDDNTSSPTDLLHADMAIQVDDRVFITLGGLNPNTTYYVRVQPVVKRDMGVTDSSRSNDTLIGFFVARTMVKELTCRFDDKVYKNGATVKESCKEICKCVNGHVKCQSACPDEKFVIAPSATCPQPRLVPSDRSCCKTWKCFPEEDGCFHGDLFLKNGEEVYDGSCAGKCRCTDGELTCTPVCPPVSPAPRADCVLRNMTNTCCPVWMCRQETKPPVGMSMASRIGLQGICSDEDTYKASLGKAFGSRLEGYLPCADKESPYFIMCWVKDVSVACSQLEAYRKRRQTTTEIEVVAVVTANITESNTASKVQSALNVTDRTFSAIFSTRNFWVRLDNGQNLTSSGNFLSLGLAPICDNGFIYKGNVCVSESFLPDATSLQRHNVSMTLVNISHHSATFVWPSLPRNSLTYVTGLVIEFRETSSAVWNRTLTLQPASTGHTVMSLSASRQYEARLVALTNSSSAYRVSLSFVRFTTENDEVLTGALTFDPLRVSLGHTSVTISWTSLVKSVTSAIRSLRMTYRKSQDTDHVISLDLDPNIPHVSLENLASGTAYVCKFQAVLVNGSTVTSPPLHFVTTAEDSSDVPLIPLLATCAVLVLLAVLIPVAFFVWRRTRRKSTSHTAFENKTYEVNITSLCSNRPKNDSARPQDPENGDVVPNTGNSEQA